MRKAASSLAVLGLVLVALLLMAILQDASAPDVATVAGDPSSVGGHDPVRLRGQSTGQSTGQPEHAEAAAPGAGVEEPTASSEPIEAYDGVFRLRVVDADGAGVAGVETHITLRPRRGGTIAPLVVQAAWRSGLLRTDAEGRIRIPDLDIDGAVAMVHFASGPEAVVLPSDTRYAVSEEEAVFELARAASIEGRIIRDTILDTDELPQDRVALTAYWTHDGEKRVVGGQVAADWSFRVGGLDPDAVVELLARPTPRAVAVTLEDGRVIRWVNALETLPPATGWTDGVRAGARGVAIDLVDGIHVRFRAVNEDGRALRRQMLRLEPGEGAALPVRYDILSGDGWLDVRGVHPGPYRVVPGKGEHAAREIHVPFAADTLVFPAARTGAVTGRVLGAGDLTGFRVSFRQPATGDLKVVITNAQGEFVGPQLTGPVDLLATRFGDPRCAHLAGVDAEASDVQLALERGLEIRGRVLDVNGEVMNFAGWVTAEGQGVFERTSVLPGGRFAFPALPRGRYTLCVGGDGPTSETAADGVEAGSRDVVIRIPERR